MQLLVAWEARVSFASTVVPSFTLYHCPLHITAATFKRWNAAPVVIRTGTARLYWRLLRSQATSIYETQSRYSESYDRSMTWHGRRRCSSTSYYAQMREKINSPQRNAVCISSSWRESNEYTICIYNRLYRPSKMRCRIRFYVALKHIKYIISETFAQKSKVGTLQHDP